MRNKAALALLSATLYFVFCNAANPMHVKLNSGADMNKANSSDQSSPPLSPTGEQLAPNDIEFVMKCLSQLNALSKMGKIEPGPHLLTTSKRWGLVFRADFTINGDKLPDAVDRLICWREDSGKFGMTFAMGQNIAPLTENDIK